MHSLRRVVNSRDTRSGLVFDLAMQGFILLSLICFSLETLPGLSSVQLRLLRVIEFVTVAIFTLEYLLRIYVAESRLRFAASFFGIIDLLAIAPFYLSLGVDLRALRAFRLLRLFRLFKLARYNSAAVRFHRAFLIAKEELILFLSVTVILLFLAAVGIHYFENEVQPDKFSSVFHSLWWAVATLTTVGYGDVYPITAGGRIFTFLILMLGLGVVSVPAGLVAAALSKAREMESPESSTRTRLD